MPRLFVGLEVPALVRSRLSQMKGGFSGARWVEPEDLHITLCFIGDIDNRLASDVHDALTTLTGQAVPIRMTGLDVFGGDKPHSLFAKVDAHPGLMHHQSDVERVVCGAGAAIDKRRFQPHVTLARLRGAQPRDLALYLSAQGYFPALEYTAHRFALYSSRASTGGGPYHIEATYPLQTGADAQPSKMKA